MIPIKNVFYMLAYAFRALDRKAYRPLESEDFANAEDLLAAILILGVEEQFKRGVSRAYIEEESPLTAVKGRVRIEESIRTCRRNARLVCARDEFSVNAYMNRILVTAMQALVRSEEVASARRKALRAALCMLREVTPLDPRNILWNFRYDRNNQAYRLLMYVCRLVLEDRLPAQSDRKKPGRLFDDDQTLPKLYEKFILGYFQRTHPRLQPRSEFLDWTLDDNDGHSLLPVMHPDVTLKDAAGRMLILDAKFYDQATVVRYEKTRLHSENLYQIFAYVKNAQASRNPALPAVSGMLLYAGTDEKIQPDVSCNMSGNRISVRTLDLNRPFDDIRARLDAIAAEYFPE